MPSGPNRSSLLDSSEVVASEPGLEELASAAEAEAAEAESQAQAARARAAELRHNAAASAADTVESSDTAELDDKGSAPETRTRRMSWGTAAGAAAILLSIGLLALSGFLVWHHRQALEERQQAAEYEATARQVVVTLMSLDAATAPDAVQSIIASSTGPFKAEFEGAADEFVSIAADADVSTNAEVKAAAVQSMTADEAQVLVTATSTISNAAGADEQPRSWRLSVTLVREGEEIKMSQLEFVP